MTVVLLGAAATTAAVVAARGVEGAAAEEVVRGVFGALCLPSCAVAAMVAAPCVPLISVGGGLSTLTLFLFLSLTGALLLPLSISTTLTCMPFGLPSML